jgi:hypothetical protein
MKIKVPVSPSVILVEIDVISPILFDYKGYVVINLMNIQKALYYQTREYTHYLTLRDMYVNQFNKLNKLEDKFIKLYHELSGKAVKKVDYKHHEIRYVSAKLKGIQERKSNHETGGIMHNRLIERELECINELKILNE